MDVFYYAHVDLSGNMGSPGSVRHVLQVVNGLSERGHSVTLFVPEPSGSLPDTAADRIITFPSHNGPLGFLLGVLICSLRLLGEAIRSRPDCIYCREMLFTAHTAVLGRLIGVPHVTEINGFQPGDVPLDPDFPCQRYPLLVLAEGLNYWLSEGLIVVSDGLQKKLVNYYRIDPDRLTTIKNGVDTGTFHPPESHDRDEDHLRVGFLGHLFPWSGATTLVRSIPRVRASVPDVQFEIVGDGDSLDELKTLADELDVTEAIDFVGRIERDRVPEVLRRWSVGVSPYTSERTTMNSLKTYEYLASGLPVVVSDRPELADLVHREECGLVFEAESAEDLAGRLVTLLESPERRRTMGTNGRRAVETDHDWNRTVERTENWLYSMLNDNTESH